MGSNKLSDWLSPFNNQSGACYIGYDLVMTNQSVINNLKVNDFANHLADRLRKPAAGN